MIKLLGFAPDRPTTDPGIITDCTNFIPYEAGMTAAKSASSYSDALAAACLGCFVGTKLDSSRRVFAGTSTKLYELSGTSWTDRSRGANYTLGSTSRWCFAQFGDTSLAANLDNVIQSSSAGAFADIATAPQAAVIEAVLSSGGGFVFAFNTIDGTYGTSPDRWWCSAVNDQSTWTPSIASQATTGRLLGFEGKVVTAKKLGADRIVAYKAGSMYLGTYVGPPQAWSWQELPGFGCVGLDAVANMGTAHFVVGEDNIFIFDGARPIPIADDVRQWFIDNSSGQYRNRTIVSYDRDNNIVRIHFPESASADGTPNKCLVYHLLTKRWGRQDMSIEAALAFSAPTDTFDTGSGTFDADTGTFDDVSAGNKVSGIFNTSHVLALLSGTPGDSSFTTQDMGDDNQVTHLTKATLRYMTTPTSASVDAFSTMATGLSQTAGPSQSAYDVPANGSNQFPLRQTGRWHRLKFNFTGNTKVTGLGVDLKPAGKR